jgi:crotonobetainyl-CoA:carnitine CoA-transferase CaiB-like acyl-CoA transferase
MKPAPATQSVLNALANRLTHSDGFDPLDHLTSVLAGIGMAPQDSGGKIEFIEPDPIIPSVFRIASAAGIGLAAESVAMASLWRARGGAGQDIEVDLRKAPHRLCPFYDRKWEKLNGYPPRNPADPETPFSLAFYETRDRPWVMPLNLYPRLKTAALRLLDCADDPKAVAHAVRQWDAADLEIAGAKAGVVMPMIRSQEAAAVRPGIIHASVSLHGQTGPWADRPGFDQSAGCVSGVVTLEGTPQAPKLPAILVVNDYLGAWLLTTGIVAALMRRAREGGSYRVHVSLTRLSIWLYTLGLFDKDYAQATANGSDEHRYLDPENWERRTSRG